MMPSFFFHIAFDLDAPGSLEPHPKSRAQHPEPSKLPESSQEDHNTSPGPERDLPVSHDWRYGRVSAKTVAMAQVAALDKHGGEKADAGGHITNGISAGPGGLATKGRYEPLEPQQENLGWGVVRLYRDAEETPGLYDEPTTPTKHSKNHKGSAKKDPEDGAAFQDEDCTTLCILAVPSYLTPSDFLGFVGEKTRDEVSHFRMIRTERSNRYMVLMKFRNGKKARQWRKEWNGRAFDGMEPENCHVVFVKSISFRLPASESGQISSFPDMTNDPFTPSITLASSPPPGSLAIQSAPLKASSSSSATTTAPTRPPTKPAPPPTPSLVELPTCPVCLERMDESTGLLTILCQHVFHCSCLQKWKGSGCPVCRYTHSSFPYHKRSNSQNHSSGEAAETGLNECTICRSDANLWICLICGSVGCGRYDAAHAFAHYEASGHCFAMELASQRVWDYASDVYVHRIIQDKTDGKFVELTHPSDHDFPSHTNPNNPSNDSHHRTTHDDDDNDDDFDDYVPRSKLTNIGLEYTSLLTSQLDSQRLYFEEILERAADKASRAAASADSALHLSSTTAAQLAALQLSHQTLQQDTLPALEKDRDRAARKAEKFEAMARKLEREWRDEKAMNGSLLERCKRAAEEVDGLKREKAELEEMNRDLGVFISAGEKLREIGVAGGGEGVEGGTVSLPPAASAADDEKGKEGGKKGKGKGKGGKK